MNRNTLYAVVVLVFVTFVMFSRLHSPKDELDGGGIACTADAMICPDGSYVGRSGPTVNLYVRGSGWALWLL